MVYQTVTPLHLSTKSRKKEPFFAKVMHIGIAIDLIA